MLKTPDFKIGSDAQRILDLMKERIHETDTLVTYREIEMLTGKDRAASRGAFYTARGHIRADYSKWYVNVPKVGYRIAPDENLPDVGKNNRSRARNIHRETIKVLAIVDPEKQSALARTRTMLERSVAELGMAATAPRAISKAEQIVSRSHNELTSEQQLEAIKDALTKK